jgi:hypothetical protein
MPVANQISFSNKELLELLIKKAGVHEGNWILMVNFGFTAGNFGPTGGPIAPGVVVTINHVGIQRAAADSLPEMWLDAAIVNPESKSK